MNEQESTDQIRSAPGVEYQRLNIFIGQWNTTGEVLETSNSPAAKIDAIDTYEWMAGEFFLLHHIEARIGDNEVKALEIIGYDDSSRTYFSHSFDNQGNADTFQANLRGSVWTIEGKTARFEGVFSDDGKILTGKWEKSDEDSGWSEWMNVKLTKSASRKNDSKIFDDR
jgi:hypothetical protein